MVPSSPGGEGRHGMPARRHGLARRRKMVGFSQERLAEALGVDRSTVVRWERAETEPQPWHRPRLAAVLNISVDELASILAPAPARRPPPTPALSDETAARGAITPEARADDLAVVRSFRSADRHGGGVHLYAAVASYLQRVVAPRVFGQTRDRDGERVFAAAGSLTEMAGWRTTAGMTGVRGSTSCGRRAWRWPGGTTSSPRTCSAALV